jgi:hypothetical protein
MSEVGGNKEKGRWGVKGEGREMKSNNKKC